MFAKENKILPRECGLGSQETWDRALMPLHLCLTLSKLFQLS